ncbi:MAG TPA: clostripain-related cysteine peptidase [Polyangiaceae bacterium]|nr:clostripain-related cysteine peptidase [Polyangiaceae bacterium]
MLRSNSYAFLLVTLGCMLGTVTGCSSNNGDDDDDDGGQPGDIGSGGSGNSSATGGTTSGGGTSGSSGKGGSSGTPPTIDELEPDAEAAWTVFVYGHGDHNLSNSLLADLAEMAKADLGAPGDFNLLVLTDWNASQTIAGSDPPERFPTGVQLFRVPGKGKDLEVVAEGAEENLDDPDVLASVTADVFKAFPAEHHGVVLWDHGGAWSGGFGHDTQDGTDMAPKGLPAESIPPALLAGASGADISARPPLDFVAFDTCLMGGAEVAYPFKQLASLYIANAEIDYGNGWDYTATFSYLASHTDATPAAFAKAEVSQWDAHHENASTNDALLRSHAAIDLTKMDAFVQATSLLTNAISTSESFDPVDLGRGSFLALPPYASQFENAGSVLPGLHDLGQVLDALGASQSDATVAAAAKKARTALDALLIATSQGSLRSDASQAGFHVELGAASTLTADHVAEYKQRAASWDGDSGWSSVLATLAGGADSTPPAYTHSVDNADGATASKPPVLRFKTADADAAKASVYLGRDLDADTLVVLGLVAAAPIDANEDYELGWDGTVTTFADDQPAMLDIWLDTGSADGEAVLMIPGVLDGAAEEGLVTYLVFAPSEGGPSVAVVVLGDVASTLSVEELVQAAPRATFSPLYYVVSKSSGQTELVTGDAMPLPASGTFELKSSFVGAGGYYLFSSLTDVWGNQGVEVDAFELAEPLGQ